jgi:hypothetical protein
MKNPALDRPAPSRRRKVMAGAVAAVVVVLVLIVGALVVTGGPWRDDDAPAAAAATTSSAPATPTATSPQDQAAPAAPAAPAVPEATGPTGDVNVLPASLPSVGLDEPAASDDGVRVEVLSVDAVDGVGSGPGNVSGPALRVTLELTNGTTAPIALDLVSIGLTHGTDRTPASPLNDPSAAPFAGTLQPGTTGEGVYVFSVPTADRDLVTVSVGYRAGAPYLVFSGAAA